MRTRKRQLVVVGIVAAAFGIGTYAFTASNTVPATSAGAGSGAISGYAITNVAYGLNGTTPTEIDQVTFTIAPAAASTVRIQLAAGGPWYTCANASGTVTCDTTSPQATVAGATQLTVVATQ